jgi:hypothetical protein
LRPERLRTVERPFGWIPFRLLTSGILPQLSAPAMQLYFLLCLVADRQGLSYYGDERLSRLLKLPRRALTRARAELCREDLLAFDGRLYQLLSLPPGAPRREVSTDTPPSLGGAWDTRSVEAG